MKETVVKALDLIRTVYDHADIMLRAGLTYIVEPALNYILAIIYLRNEPRRENRCSNTYTYADNGPYSPFVFGFCHI